MRYELVARGALVGLLPGGAARPGTQPRCGVRRLLSEAEGDGQDLAGGTRGTSGTSGTTVAVVAALVEKVLGGSL